MAFYERSELFGKYPKTPVFDHSNYRLFERIPAVPGTSNNRDLTVYVEKISYASICRKVMLVAFVALSPKSTAMVICIKDRLCFYM